MAQPVTVEYIGWEDDFRYAAEKARITDHIQKMAEARGYSHACVQDMIMKYRYRSQGPWIDVHFQSDAWVRDGLNKYVFARLWFNEDGDLEKEPEFVEKASI
ncbi:hypothetical protein CCM_03671 [Cordyceps militaris CM01]|uniref:Uncharacterized protein n=1 Tax=Cordyceps militaris (strain CM01) TaxID=983644 RepID=G3JFR6_CORMM|nr:uncharacterized protein CCM_03671 [Cordyceps militaris CM01]EGX92299.1 hypothetical protein CCM_03671 [Cordyceps militaris CM01]